MRAEKETSKEHKEFLKFEKKKDREFKKLKPKKKEKSPVLR